MATTAITCELLTVNVAGEDNLDGGNGSGAANGLVAATPADGWVVSPPAGHQFDERLVFRLIVDGTGDTIVFTAGDEPPAMRSGLGNLSITMAASDVRMIAIETSRFMQSDGTIVVTCTDTGSRLQAYMLPKGP